MKSYILLACFYLCVGLCAEEADKEKKSAETKEAVDPNLSAKIAQPVAPPPPVKPWWMQSAVPVGQEDKWKIRFELDTKYTYQMGTLDSHLIECNTLLAIRKNRFTNFMFLDAGFMSADQKFAFYAPDENGDLARLEGRQKILLRKVQFVDVFRTDITKNIFFDLGFEAFRDDLTYIRKRLAYYGGLGYQFDVNKKHFFTFIGGFGYEETEYTPRDQLVARGVPLSIDIKEMPDSTAFFFQYKGKIMLSEKIEFHQSFFYTAYLESERTDRWEAKLRLMFPLRRNLSFFTAFECNYEKNFTAEIAGAEKFNMKLVNGLRFSF